MSNVSMIDGHIDETKLKDEDIIKGLECCRKKECITCPCYDDEIECVEMLIGYTLNLINRKDEMINSLIAGQETLQKHLAEKLKKGGECL